MGIFTGLIMEVGTVRRFDRRSDGAYLVIECVRVLEGTRPGDSISINGVDLTVVEMEKSWFASDVSLETLKRSTLGSLRPRSRVNLERALGVGERLGGHIVQGHVDGPGELISAVSEGNAYRMRFRFADDIRRYIAMKGSIAVDGISLTVAGLGEDWFEVAIIPHTWKETTLGNLAVGERVNLEVDVLAKYVERLLEGRGEGEPPRTGLSVDYLIEQGY